MGVSCCPTASCFVARNNCSELSNVEIIEAFDSGRQPQLPKVDGIHVGFGVDYKVAQELLLLLNPGILLNVNGSSDLRKAFCKAD